MNAERRLVNRWVQICPELRHARLFALLVEVWLEQIAADRLLQQREDARKTTS
jgi:hypothetical protein